jgi:hypothetical protein
MNGRGRRAGAGLTAGFVIGFAGIQLVFVLSSVVHAATWTSNNCNGDSTGIPAWKRSQAQNYAQKADHEGYEWGGGCYKLNDRDDTRGEPDSGGEGADCSGLVFRTWALQGTDGAGQFRLYQYEKAIHGPYSTADYDNPANGDPFSKQSKSYSSTIPMDAFVYHSGSGGHIGMVYSEGSGGSDYIVEAKSDALGSRIAWEDYRSQSAYDGVGRKNWTPECYPSCG